MVLVGCMIVVCSIGKDRLMKVIVIIIWLVIVVLVVGLLIGGFIIIYVLWYWIFLMNVLFGFVVFIVVMCVVCNEYGYSKWLLDVIGFLFLGVVLILLLYGIEIVSYMEFNIKVVVGFVVFGVVFGYCVWGYM